MEKEKKQAFIVLGILFLVAIGSGTVFSFILNSGNSLAVSNGNFGEVGVSDLGYFEQPLGEPQDFALEGDEPEAGTEIESEESLDGQENEDEKLEDGNTADEQENAEESAEDDESSSSVAFAGNVLVDGGTKFIEFNQDDYSAAKDSGKTVVLYFYANWCSICRAETLVLEESFKELNSEKVIGFRVNFQDDDTDDVEKELAKEFSVVNQHTKVILKPGGSSQVDPAPWADKEKYLTALEPALRE